VATTKRPLAPSSAAAPPRKPAAAPPRAAPAKNVKCVAGGEENKSPGDQGVDGKGGGGKGGGKSIEELLAMHNKQFKPKVPQDPLTP
jgi:hypothetical protein